MSRPDEAVKVFVRVRPISSLEVRQGRGVVVEASPERSLISLRNPKASDTEPPKDFLFDSVFGPDVEQKHIYDVCAAAVVESVLNGYNGTIFTFGQTGSGKTHTMEGYSDPPTLRGIIPNCFQHIFEFIEATSDSQFLVRASYLEIYNEEIRDLLSKEPTNALQIKESADLGFFVKDLTSLVVKNVADFDRVLQAGKRKLSVGGTAMNVVSSRSHVIFTIVIEAADANGEHVRVGKLNLVDLVGSERQSKTGATGHRLKEANKINLSLVALGNVITALADAKKSTFVPYRDSKLTRLLQNSLGGNANTVMCATCSPADCYYDETLSILRYATRAMNIKNKPKINEDPKDAMLRVCQNQIELLKSKLVATSCEVIEEVHEEVSPSQVGEEKQLLKKQGGEKQEALFRDRNAQEATLARELAENEELTLLLEEHFSRSEVELDVKTKVKQLQNKYQAAIREAKDLQEEFQSERTDMLATIRQLTLTLRLKDAIITHSVSAEVAKELEARAVYDQDEDSWVVPQNRVNLGKHRYEGDDANTSSSAPPTSSSYEAV